MICDKELPNHYVLYWVKTNMGTIKGNANGTTFDGINKCDFKPIKVIVPCQRILENYVQQIEALHQQAVLNVRESKALAALRDVFFPKFVSGELRVLGAEKFATAVTS